jgi:lipopolysaccharide assembly outer membrane protein LptD (OstA)
MTSRIRLLITAAVLCHLLLAPRLVTSQLLPVSAPRKNPPPAPGKRSEPVNISAVHQEKDGAVYKLRDQVKIDYGVYTFYADQVTYDSDSGNIQAEGHLLLEGGPNHEHIEASRGTYNLNSEIGRFENVTGSIGVKTNKVAWSSCHTSTRFSSPEESWKKGRIATSSTAAATHQLPPKVAIHLTQGRGGSWRNAAIYQLSY